MWFLILKLCSFGKNTTVKLLCAQNFLPRSHAFSTSSFEILSEIVVVACKNAMFISFLSPAKFKRLSFKRLKMESTAFPINNMDNLYNTQIIKMNPLQLQDDSFSVPVSIIQSGNVVAFPTETVYGLGANALDGNACKKVFLLEKRIKKSEIIILVDFSI